MNYCLPSHSGSKEKDLYSGEKKLGGDRYESTLQVSEVSQKVKTCSLSYQSSEYDIP